MWVHLCKHPYEGQRSNIGTILNPQELSALLGFEMGSLINLELNMYARLAGPQAPDLPPSYYILIFCMVSGERIQGLKIVYKHINQ